MKNLGQGDVMHNEVRIPTKTEFEELKVALANIANHPHMREALGAINSLTREQNDELFTVYWDATKSTRGPSQYQQLDNGQTMELTPDGLVDDFKQVMGTKIVIGDFDKYIQFNLNWVANKNDPEAMKAQFARALTNDNLYLSPEQIRAVQQISGITDSALVGMDINVTQGIKATFTTAEVSAFLDSIVAGGLDNVDALGTNAVEIQKYFVNPEHKFTQEQVAMAYEKIPFLHKDFTNQINIVENSPEMQAVIEEEHTFEDMLKLEFKTAYEENIKPLYKTDLSGLLPQEKRALRRDMYKQLAGNVHEGATLPDLDKKAIKKLYIASMNKLGFELPEHEREESNVADSIITEFKNIQSFIQGLDNDTAQIFRDPAMIEMIKNSDWQTISTELAKASTGEKSVFGNSILSGITDKGVLQDIGEMIKTTSGNELAIDAFRSAMIDQIADGLEITRDLLEKEQSLATRGRDSVIYALTNTKDKHIKTMIAGIDFSTLEGFGNKDFKKIDTMHKQMQANLDALNLPPEIKESRQDYIDGLFKNTVDSIRFGMEVNRTSFEINDLNLYRDEIGSFEEVDEVVLLPQKDSTKSSELGDVGKPAKPAEKKKTDKDQPELSDITNKHDLAKHLRKLNPGVDIRVHEFNDQIFSSAPMDKLKLPVGFEVCSRNGLSNKGRTVTGAYIAPTVKPLEGAHNEALVPLPRGTMLHGYLRPDCWTKDYTNALAQGDTTGALNFIKQHVRENGKNGCPLMLADTEVAAMVENATPAQLDDCIKYIGKYHGDNHVPTYMMQAAGDKLSDKQKQKLFDKVYSENNKYTMKAFEEFAPDMKPSIFGKMKRVHKDAFKQAAYGNEMGSRNILDKIKGAAKYVKNMGSAIGSSISESLRNDNDPELVMG